ncbi:DgyrCDS1173 [Dimorphilus gyrociliatus]|uniref:DgyrCDS1173 n=1 Tax=Dimorphilus gyrociliatus TaxID=2664684 RepID=A0A7I8V8B1_9ANNE|nr:DgyrCDS1173 [Dimorphilus gyrociliatus]
MSASRLSQEKGSMFQEPEGKLTYEEWELTCSICLETMTLPSFGKCAHSFCFQCISQHVQISRSCPICYDYLHEDLIFFNKNLEYFISEKKLKESCANTKGLGNILNHNRREKDLKKAESMSGVAARLVLKRLADRLNKVDKDIKIVEEVKERITTQYCPTPNKRPKRVAKETKVENTSLKNSQESSQSCSLNLTQLSASFKTAQLKVEEDRPPKVHQEKPVESLRLKETVREVVKIGSVHTKHISEIKKHTIQSYNSFGPEYAAKYVTELHNSITKYDLIKCVRGFHIDKELIPNIPIIPSLDVDKDNVLLCAADTAKNINVYFIPDLISNRTTNEISPAYILKGTCNFSSLSWQYFRSVLVSGDRDGCVASWDINRQSTINKYQEHHGRCWSVCCSSFYKNVSLTGGDDGQLKIWDFTMNYSASTISVPSKVLSVKLNPSKACEALVGLANNKLLFYDLRKFSYPLLEIKAHEKAVSSAKYLNEFEVVTSSNDASMKLWDISNLNKDLQPIRTFSKRSSKKEMCFTGLCCNKDMIACGTEQNTVQVYHKSLSDVWLVYKYVGDCNIEHPLTICSVTWDTKNDILFSADHMSFLKVLQLHETCYDDS